jgi:guanylate kinase
MPEALTIFIMPPSWDELVRRLNTRGTENEAEQAKRLETAVVELAAADSFEFQVINDDVDKCAAKVLELMS